MMTETHLRVAAYYAPRGRKRLHLLGRDLAQRYLQPSDLLVGIIGAEGAGKSTLIQGLFPGLELTNDDDGANVKQNHLFSFSEESFFSPHTFHLDVRYELAFHQVYEIVDAIHQAIKNNRRVVVEHFDLIYEALGYNAQIIFGIGEEVKVYRPSVFWPSPLAIKQEVDETIKYRLMAHSAEDIISFILKRDYDFTPPVLHSEVKHGFVMAFHQKPSIDLAELEKKVQLIIELDLCIKPDKGDVITLGQDSVPCTGKRIHVKSTGEIENFRLLKDYKYDPITEQYLLVGFVGREKLEDFNVSDFWREKYAIYFL